MNFDGKCGQKFFALMENGQFRNYIKDKKNRQYCIKDLPDPSKSWEKMLNWLFGKLLRSFHKLGGGLENNWKFRNFPIMANPES